MTGLALAVDVISKLPQEAVFAAKDSTIHVSHVTIDQQDFVILELYTVTRVNDIFFWARIRQERATKDIN